MADSCTLLIYFQTDMLNFKFSLFVIEVTGFGLMLLVSAPTMIHSAGLVLDDVPERLRNESARFMSGGGKPGRQVEDGQSCVPGSEYYFPPDHVKEHDEIQLNKIGTDILGKYCKTKKCHYHYESGTFRCRSSTIQPLMATLIVVPTLILVVTSGVLNPL